MSDASLQRNLARLVELQQLTVERQQAEFASQQQLCARVRRTVERLESLGAQASLSGTQLPGLAQNHAAYKQAMLNWAEQQRQELARREAELDQARQAVLAAARREESLQTLLQRTGERVRSAEARREQKQQDEIANQSQMGNLTGFGSSGWGRDA